LEPCHSDQPHFVTVNKENDESLLNALAMNKINKLKSSKKKVPPMKPHDVVIAGCGMAGALAGLTALKKNLTVCIVEKNKREYIGKKICGELMTQKSRDWLKNEFNLSITSYPLKGLEICSSSGHKVHVPIPLCTIDRWKVGQTMLQKVLTEGAEVTCKTVKGPLGEPVKGVKTKDTTIHSTVTIDCSGVASVLRRTFTPGEPAFLGVAYKENLILKEPVTTDYALLMFDKNVIPAGYVWCFPKSEYEVNVGAGGLVRGKAFLKKILEKAVKTLGITVKRREFPGFGVVPLGRPLPSLVYPGLLVCGDAASQVNPLTGEGIAPALKAGYLAGKVAAEAVANDDISVEGMWKYNCDFAREYGATHASLFVARNFLVSLSGEELTYFLRSIVTGDDLSQLLQEGTAHKGMKKVVAFLKNWRRPRLLYRMYAVLILMNEIKRLYTYYPETPEGFSVWQQNLDYYLKKGRY